MMKPPRILEYFCQKFADAGITPIGFGDDPTAQLHVRILLPDGITEDETKGIYLFPIAAALIKGACKEFDGQISVVTVWVGGLAGKGRDLHVAVGQHPPVAWQDDTEFMVSRKFGAEHIV